MKRFQAEASSFCQKVDARKRTNVVLTTMCYVLMYVHAKDKCFQK